LAFVNDLIGTNENQPKNRPLIRKIKDYCFATFAFPLAMNVGLLFHVLMLIDRKLVMPAEVDE
jgi:FAR-17a/AIG1-like protein